MNMELTLTAALLMGLLGSTHCVGMCGGIVGTLTLGLAGLPSPSRAGRLGWLLAYNGGRILSYSVAGGVAGLLSGQATRLGWQPDFPLGGLIAGLFMIALGLYLAGWWRALVALEHWGAKLWRHIEPLGRRFLPVRSVRQAFGLGVIWGWLPCGLVYAALAWSLASASPFQGAALMFAFGLGTLPMLLLMGSAAHALNRLARAPAVRRSAGILVIALGLYMLSTLGDGAHRHTHPASESTLPNPITATLPAPCRTFWGVHV